MTSSRKGVQPRTSRSRITGALPYLFTGLLGLFLLYLAFAGYGFGASRGSFNSLIENHDRAVELGRVPFSADQLVWLPIGLAFLTPLALPLIRRTAPLTAFRFLSGALIAAALLCVAVEIVWVATGKPYHAYSVAAASQSDYAWPILGLAGLAVVFALPHIYLAIRSRRRAVVR